MGIKDPIGKTIHLWGEDREIIVRLQAGQESATIDRLEKLYKADNAGLAFEYRFLDEDYQAANPVKSLKTE